MNTCYIDDFEDSCRQLLETLEGKNINILIGAGASMPYLKSLQFKKSNLTFEDLYEESCYEEYDKRIYDYLSACFIYNSIVKGTYDEIKMSDDKDCSIIRCNYKTFITNLYNILLRNSIQQPKRANIFTTNYDMFFEYAFDEIVRNNSNINFNDGSYGFVNKTVSTARFHTKVLNVGVDSRFEFELPMFNLLKLHGSLNWKIDMDAKISIYNELKDDLAFSDQQINEISKLDLFVNCDSAKQVLHNIEESISGEYGTFSNLLDKLTIVKPTKKKFSETVLEEHYYQMLRILSQELERKQCVLISFGFSFCDEHICSIIKRSLSNPNLLMYIFCYDKKDVARFEELFGAYNNVKLVVRKDDGVGDFNFFNTMLGGI